MKKQLLSGMAALTLLATYTGCGSSSDFVATSPPINPVIPPLVLNQALIWQNPFMSTNPTNNIHGDSYLSDSVPYAGPLGSEIALQLVESKVEQVDVAGFIDPYTGESEVVVIGECAGQAYDADGNIQTVAAGFPNVITGEFQRHVVTIDKESLKVLAILSFASPFDDLQSALQDFGGAGYFYQDDQYRMVLATPDGRIQVLKRQDSPLSTVDQYVAVRDIDVVGAIPVPQGLTALSLYALVPDKAGNIWFSTSEGVVGYVDLADQVHWFDINDPDGDGTRTPQPDGDLETIANSHAVDEGDSDGGPSGIYILSTHKQYRFQVGAGGDPEVAWSMAYDRGTAVKPGQVSQGSGTSPTVFNMGGRRFVAIGDNAQFMNVLVFRAETTLEAGEDRLFAQVTPFGGNASVSDENSLIVAPAPGEGGGVDIYAENNYGYMGFNSVEGEGVTQPGFARMRLEQDGTFTVADVNNTIMVPTVVSKISVPGQTVYTYEKRTSGWFLTGLDAQDLNNYRFSVQTGGGRGIYNNHYSALSLDPDGRTIWIGTGFGLTRIRP